MNVHWDQINFTIAAQGRKANVIGAIPDQLITEHRVEEVRIEDGEARQEVARDLLKIAVIERHAHTGRHAVGFVKGIGLQQGAIASSVAHDHHNIVVVGADDASMMRAARTVGEMHGGMCAVVGDEVRARLPLPIAGLMSDQPIATVRANMDALIAAAHALGSPLHDPFMAMSFLALEVIPNLKITDHGLVDVVKFQTIPLFVE
jgi:adenine deaminase